VAFLGPILVVDDDEAYRNLLKHCLEELGYSILEATNGASAWRIASRELVPLMILDINMPDTDGLETIRRLRTRGVRIPILAVSGAGRGREYLRLAVHFGADARIEKSRPMAELVTLVRKLLGGSTAGHRTGAIATVQSHCSWPEHRIIDISNRSDK